MFNFYLSFHEFEKADDSSLRRLLSIALYPVEEIPHFSDRGGVGGWLVYPHDSRDIHFYPSPSE